MLKKPNILVVGSFVMDAISTTKIFPKSGETVLGEMFDTAPGGKGANQGVQAALFGATVTMVGKVGDDDFGKRLVSSAKNYGVDTRNVLVDRTTSSGVGNVILEQDEYKNFHNRIIVLPGSNMTITKGEVSFLERDISSYDMVMLQLEIPSEINRYIIDLANKNNIPVMLNSAPYREFSEDIFGKLTYISPNEHEAEAMTGIKATNEDGSINMEAIHKITDKILSMDTKNVIVTLGGNGAVVASNSFFEYRPCIKDVLVKDPTAAGDSFVGAFCATLSMGLSPTVALEIANYTASITVSKKGAQPSLPTITEVIEVMKKNNYRNDIIDELINIE